MKIKKLNLSTELISEIVYSIPFDTKWDAIRVSKLFDLFLVTDNYDNDQFGKINSTKLLRQ